MQTITKKSKANLAKKHSNSSVFNKKLLPQHLNKKLQISNEKLNELIALLNAGALDECVKTAKQLANLFPNNGLVWKILGTAYQKKGFNDLSIQSLKKAYNFLPDDFEVTYNIANAHFDLKEFDEAINFYKKTTELSPNFLEAYFNLGSVYEINSEFDLAELTYRKVLEISPIQSNAYFSLADLFNATKSNLESKNALNLILDEYLSSTEASLALAIEFERLERIEESDLFFKHATLLKPDNISDLYIAYSDYFSKKGNLTKAIDYLNKTLELKPDNFNANSHLGLIYLEQKQFTKAEIYLNKAIQIDKNEPSGYIHYGLFLYRKGDLVDAEMYLKKALALSSDNVVALNNLGLVYEALFDHARAVDTFRHALKINPDYLPSLSNIALSLNRLGKQTEAIQYARQGLAQYPTNKALLINAAVIYQGIGEIHQAINANLKAIDIDHENMLAYNNLFYSLCLTKNYTTEFFSEKLKQFGSTVTNMATVQYSNWPRAKNTKRVKIGFVSADFFDHPVGSFLLNVIQNITKNHFQIVAYTNNPHEDEITAALKHHFDDWVSIVGLSDQDAAEIIHTQGVDLLIDLSGHTSGNRLSMFAYKPAPVQMTWLGYWDSTGVEQIDYILLDEMSAPEDMHNQFTEEVLYIPETRFCYYPPRIDISVNELPAIKNGFVTFGAYHNYAKVSDEVIDLWTSILNSVPTSRLRWQTKSFNDEYLIEQTLQKFIKLGISSKRIELIGFMTRKAYLESYHIVDFILDCFPFSACTTTCDGLWMGVPTLTMPSSRLGGRQGTSLMSVVGLSNWIAKDKQEFISKAIEYASDLDALSNIRKELRSVLLHSTLGDGRKYAKNLENVFKEILIKHEIIENVTNAVSMNAISCSASDELKVVIDEVYRLALHEHEHGNFEDAANGYIEILKINHTHPDANHNLGVIETHTIGVHEALPRFEAAVMAKPDSEQYWVSYIDALTMSGETQTAISAIYHGQKYGLSEAVAEILTKEIDQQLREKNLNLNISPTSDSITSMVKFIIVAPVYNEKSAGVKILHELCDDLNNLGYPTAICFTGSNGMICSNEKAHYGKQLKWYALKDKIELDQFVAEGIVIYPEIVTGNPLNAKNVVRYILNSEGFVGKNKIDASPNDYILAYTSVYYDNPHSILTKIPFNPLFNSEHTLPALERRLDVTYIGKGSIYTNCFVVPNSLEVTRQYPISKPELALLLRNTRYFYTWDYRTATFTDAILCGAIPIFMSPSPFKSFDELNNNDLAKQLRTSCEIKGDEVIVNLPDNTMEVILAHKNEVMSQINNYQTQLLDTLSKIKKHFNF
jgi:predicted O-linked N-acetylglucosamine transferase (SPINDLY family)